VLFMTTCIVIGSTNHIRPKGFTGEIGLSQEGRIFRNIALKENIKNFLMTLVDLFDVFGPITIHDAKKSTLLGFLPNPVLFFMKSALHETVFFFFFFLSSLSCFAL
jgi:hypothetical protein